MKELNIYLVEKLKLNKNLEIPKKKEVNNNTSEKIEDPKEGTIAYDYGGEEWTIEEILNLTDGKNKVRNFLKLHDTNNFFLSDFKKDGMDLFSGYDYLVLARTDDDPNFPAIWVWGRDGICYENKDMK